MVGRAIQVDELEKPENLEHQLLSLGNASFGVSPALAKPGFGLKDVDWGYETSSSTEFALQALRMEELQAKINSLPPKTVYTFSATDFFSTVSTMFWSFGMLETPKPEMAKILKLTDNPIKLADSGAFRRHGTNGWETLSGYTELQKTDGAKIFLDIEAYQAMGEMHHYNNIGLMLDFPLQSNSLMVLPELYYISSNIPPGEEIFRFHEMLASLGLPSIVRMYGLPETHDGLLGIFDKKAIKNLSSVLYPQKKNPFSIGVLTDLQNEITFLEKGHGPIYLFPAFEDPVEKLLNLEKEDSNSGLKSYSSLFLGLLEEKKPDFEKFKAMIDGTLEKLSDSQKQDKKALLGIGLANYFLKSIMSGEVSKLEGIGRISELIALDEIALAPEAAYKLRFLYMNLQPDFISFLKEVATKEGFLTSDVYNVKGQYEIEQGTAGYHKIPIKHTIPEKDPDSLSPYQDEYMDHLEKLFLERLPVTGIYTGAIKDVYKYINILEILNGNHSALNAMEPQLAVMLTAFLEHNLGLPLERLRSSFYLAQKEISALPLPAYDLDEELKAELNLGTEHLDELDDFITTARERHRQKKFQYIFESHAINAKDTNHVYLTIKHAIYSLNTKLNEDKRLWEDENVEKNENFRVLSDLVLRTKSPGLIQHIMLRSIKSEYRGLNEAKHYLFRRAAELFGNTDEGRMAVKNLVLGNRSDYNYDFFNKLSEGDKLWVKTAILETISVSNPYSILDYLSANGSDSVLAFDIFARTLKEDEQKSSENLRIVVSSISSHNKGIYNFKELGYGLANHGLLELIDEVVTSESSNMQGLSYFIEGIGCSKLNADYVNKILSGLSRQKRNDSFIIDALIDATELDLEYAAKLYAEDNSMGLYIKVLDNKHIKHVKKEIMDYLTEKGYVKYGIDPHGRPVTVMQLDEGNDKILGEINLLFDEEHQLEKYEWGKLCEEINRSKRLFDQYAKLQGKIPGW